MTKKVIRKKIRKLNTLHGISFLLSIISFFLSLLAITGLENNNDLLKGFVSFAVYATLAVLFCYSNFSLKKKIKIFLLF